ncbi:hypothetical protein CC117_06240 [Parafrankia colletiae]|uniref:Uncharacterized protein n=1 Tax=Parafrankia colletiae TaxID=573497 RepID=A0A1S1QAC1_9ACTN|nr:hypothetical protein [Parafrankia colletiae]MCK9901059.1 hypothetical protein [Frankia sp. Cpl3]OHV30539.1 hypothetical protein CC117_06240 [Parafrankia colletiae]
MPNITRTQTRRVVGDGRGPRLLVAVGVVAAAVTLAGCGGGGDALDDIPRPSVSARPTLPADLSSALPTGIPTSLPSGIPTAVPTSLPGVGRVDTATGADALKGTNIPPGFPVPPGATVKVGATGGSRSTVTMQGVSSDAVRTFYRQALPAAGYEITSDVGVPGVASSLGFRGNGVTGTIGAAGSGSTNGVAVVFEKQ